MEDFGHGIVDSRPVALLADGRRRSRSRRRRRARCAARAAAPRRAAGAALVAAAGARLLVVAIALLVNVIAARHYVRGDWTARRSTRSPTRQSRVLRELPRPVEATVFLYPKRDSERARADRRLRARADRALACANRAGCSTPSRRSRSRARSRRGGGQALRHRRLRDGAGGGRLRLGRALEVVTEDDLVEPEIDADGEPGPAIPAWRGEAAFVSAILAVTDDHPPLVCFTKGHGEPDIDVGRGRRLRDLRRERARRRGRDARARAPLRPRPGCRVLVIAEPTRAFSPPEIAAIEAFIDGGGRLLAMLGPVFAPGGAAFAHVGLEALAERYGVRLGRRSGRRSGARQRRRGAVGLGRRARQLRPACDKRAPRRPADLLAAHARGLAAPAAAGGPDRHAPRPHQRRRLGRDRSGDDSRRRRSGLRRRPRSQRTGDRRGGRRACRDRCRAGDAPGVPGDRPAGDELPPLRRHLARLRRRLRPRRARLAHRSRGAGAGLGPR